MSGAPDAVAVMLTFGRESAREVLAQWQRQTVRVPLFVWIDDAPELDASRVPPGVMAVHRPRVGKAPGVGAARHLAVMQAIEWAKVSNDGAVLMLDDDDFYSSRHAARTLEALTHTDFTGALAFGLESDEGAALAVVESDKGPGCHATWGFRVRPYVIAGGYEDTKLEDVALVRALARKAGVSPVGHRHLTHVRRKRPTGLMGLSYDRARVRRLARRTDVLRPLWTEECQRLDGFVREHAGGAL